MKQMHLSESRCENKIAYTSPAYGQKTTNQSEITNQSNLVSLNSLTFEITHKHRLKI